MPNGPIVPDSPATAPAAVPARGGEVPSPPAYRPFVDGLRAIAILAVVLYHVGVPGFPGGFVGVDVFFVISGYLIIGQIVHALRLGRFSFGDFWARRVLRILPPLLLVILACLVASAFVLAVPDEFNSFARQTIYSALMVVNFHFLETQGYFDTAAALKPLLHLWTLAVEEQFYLAAPIALFVIFRAAQKWPRARRAIWLAAIGVCFVASLAGSILLTSRGQNTAFYLAPYRAWEFIAGGFAGFVPLTRIGNGGLQAVALAGLAAILVAVFGFDDGIAYPSWAALLPVLGSAALIAAGVALPEVAAARVLATRPMVAIGLVSYAWYLWHWPLLSFTRIANFGDADLALDSAAALGALLLAVATYRFLERPIKLRRRRIMADRRAWIVVIVGVAACVAVSLGGGTYAFRMASDLAARIPATMQPISPFASLADEPCALNGAPTLDPHCVTGEAGRPFGLLLGDLHARVTYRTFLAAARANGAELVVSWVSACPPLIDTMIFTNGTPHARCPDAMAGGLAAAESALPGRLDFAIVEARWNQYLGEPATDPYGGDRLEIGPMAGDRPSPNQSAAVAERLKATVEQLRGVGVKRILLIAPEPEFTHYAPDCVLHADRYGSSRDLCGAPRASVEARRAAAVTALASVAETEPGVRLVDPLDLFCDGSVCRPYEGDVLLYSDDDHLSPAGAGRIVQGFTADFAWVFGANPPAGP